MGAVNATLLAFGLIGVGLVLLFVFCYLVETWGID